MPLLKSIKIFKVSTNISNFVFNYSFYFPQENFIKTIIEKLQYDVARNEDIQ